MRARRIAGWTLATLFAVFVVHASAANQCPATGLGACARIHTELMRPRTLVPVTLAAPPMRATSERG